MVTNLPIKVTECGGRQGQVVPLADKTHDVVVLIRIVIGHSIGKVTKKFLKILKKNLENFLLNSEIFSDLRPLKFSSFAEAGASSNPCSETYAGPRAFSEPETQAMASYLFSKRSQVKVYVSFHAYSQMWLTPWGYTSNVPSNFNDLMDKAKAGADAVASVYGTRYTVGSSTRVLCKFLLNRLFNSCFAIGFTNCCCFDRTDAAAGGSDDWALGVAGIPYSYTIELRPSSSAWSGFLLPKNQIMPTAVEMYAGMKRLGVEVGKGLKPGNKRIKNNNNNQRFKKKKKV